MKTINQQYQDNNDKVYKNLIDKYIIISITDTKGIITDVSEAFVNISGYVREELIGESHNIIRHPDMSKEVFKDLWATIKSGKTWRGNIKNRTKNGDYYWVDTTIDPIFGKNNKIIAYMSVRLNITDKIELATLNQTLKNRVECEVEKNREKDKIFLAKLNEDKKYLDTVIESNDHAIIAIDKNKTILTYNKKAQEIFGFTKEEMIGSNNLLNIIPLKYKNLHTVACNSYFKTGKSKGILGSTLELEGLRKDGKIIPIQISFGTNNIPENLIVVASISDITIQKQQSQMLQQQSRLAQMGEMISMIAHQWRQPLAAISATSINLIFKAQLDKLDNDTAVELGKKISEYSQHLSATIDDFRDFFKPNKEIVETNYNELIGSVLSIIADSLKIKNIELKQNLKSEVVFSTYPNEVKQVILNLIKNAEDILLEKEIENPVITIETENNILRVRDNAGGVPHEIIDKVFNPYFSTKTKKDGTGLGLYMSKTIIEEHCGGSLRVYNDEFGAVFEIELPLKKEQRRVK